MQKIQNWKTKILKIKINEFEQELQRLENIRPVDKFSSRKIMLLREMILEYKNELEQKN